MTLELGEFHGLVFFLYSLYALGGVLLATLGIAWYTKKKEWAYAAIIPVMLAEVLYLASLIIQ